MSVSYSDRRLIAGGIFHTTANHIVERQSIACFPIEVGQFVEEQCVLGKAVRMHAGAI
jgi:hypothetical protein